MYVALGLALLATLIGEISAQGACATMPYCDSCPSGTCDACYPPDPPGDYGIRADGMGCDNCYDSSGMTCVKCASMTKCDECADSSQGFVTPTDTAACGACADFCSFCSTNGATKCDPQSCADGYGFAPNDQCGPCATGCTSCSNAGAGGCDACLSGTG